MLRAATPQDAEAVTRVLVESRQSFLPYAPSPHSVQEALEWVTLHLIPAGGVTVAAIDGEIVGMLAVSEDDHSAWVEQMYLLPGYENQGIGTQLLRFAHHSVKRPIRLYTFQQNTRARRFYERHGYRAVALSEGERNEEKCPDVLYEFSGTEA